MNNKERWISPETGESTDYAKEQAEKGRESLTEEVQSALPGREVFAEMAPHTVEKGENLTKILRNHFGDEGFPNKQFLSVSYGFMEQYAGDANINFLGVGDVVSVENGKVTVKRAEGSNFGDVEAIDIYPWDGPVPPAKAEEKAEEGASEGGEEDAEEGGEEDHDPYPANEGAGEPKPGGEVEEDAGEATKDEGEVEPVVGTTLPKDDTERTTDSGDEATDDSTGSSNIANDDVERGTGGDDDDDVERTTDRDDSDVPDGDIEQVQDTSEPLVEYDGPTYITYDRLMALERGKKVTIAPISGVAFSFLKDDNGNIDMNDIISGKKLFSISEDMLQEQGMPELNSFINEQADERADLYAEMFSEAREFLSKYQDKKWFAEATINKKKKVVELVNPGAGGNPNFDYSDKFDDLDQAERILIMTLEDMHAESAAVEGGEEVEAPTKTREELEQDARDFLSKYQDKKWFKEARINRKESGVVELVNPGLGGNPNFEYSEDFGKIGNITPAEAAESILIAELDKMKAEIPGSGVVSTVDEETPTPEELEEPATPEEEPTEAQEEEKETRKERRARRKAEKAEKKAQEERLAQGVDGGEEATEAPTAAPEVTSSPEQLRQEAVDFLSKYKDKKWFAEAHINKGKKKVEIVNPGWGFNHNFNYSNFESVDQAEEVLTAVLTEMQASLAAESVVEVTSEANEVDGDLPERIALKEKLAKWNTEYPDRQVKSIVLASDESYGYAKIEDFLNNRTVERILGKVVEDGYDISGVDFVISPNMGWHSTDYVYKAPNGTKYIVVNPHGSRSRAAEKIMEQL